MKPPHHEDEDVQTEDAVVVQYAPQVVSLEGRVDPLELILHILNDTGATGVGRLLDLHEFDGERKR